MGKWPGNDVMAKCCDVYELLNRKRSCDPAEDWMLSPEFLNFERTVVLVEEKNPDIAYHKTKRLYVAFNGVKLNADDIADQESLLQIILANYKIENYFGFQKQASDYLELVLTKLKQLEASEKDSFVCYEVYFCGHAIGGSIAATAFVNLLTRLKLKSTNIPEDSFMSLQSLSDIDKVRRNLQKFRIDQKVKFASRHEFSCIIHGAAMFCNQKNKKYCIEQRFEKSIFNIIHEKDPVPKLFYQLTPEDIEGIQANQAIGKFRILQENNNKLCVRTINSKNTISIEDFLSSETNFPFDMNFHMLDIYKTPVNQGNTELDILNRMNKDMKSLGKTYECKNYIGEGSYGCVVKAIKNNNLFAIKKIKAKYQNNDRGNREIENLSKVTNQQVVTLVEHFCFKTTLYLVFEYCLYGSLESYIVSQANRLEIKEIQVLSFQLFHGLLAIHDENIIHRDIKPANILVTSLNNGNICYKISDFGSSVEYQGALKLLSAAGTPLYTSPEIYAASKKDIIKVALGKETDIFSLGAVIMFCIKKDTPWSDKQFFDLMEFGFSITLAIDYENEPWELIAMLDHMLQYEDHKRLSAKHLLLHPFIKRDSAMIADKTSILLRLSLEFEFLNNVFLSYLEKNEPFGNSYNLEFISNLLEYIGDKNVSLDSSLAQVLKNQTVKQLKIAEERYRTVLAILNKSIVKFMTYSKNDDNQKLYYKTLEDLIAAEVQEDCDISEKQLEISAIELANENIKVADKTSKLSTLEFGWVNKLLYYYLKDNEPNGNSCISEFISYLLEFIGDKNGSLDSLLVQVAEERYRVVLEILKESIVKFMTYSKYDDNQKLYYETLQDLIAAEVQKDCDISEKQLEISAIELANENIKVCFMKLKEFDSAKERSVSDAIATINDVFMIMIKYLTKRKNFGVIQAFLQAMQTFLSFHHTSFIQFETLSEVHDELVNEIVQTGALKENDSVIGGYDKDVIVNIIISNINDVLMIVMQYIINNIEVVQLLLIFKKLSATLRKIFRRLEKRIIAAEALIKVVYATTPNRDDKDNNCFYAAIIERFESAFNVVLD